MKQNTKNMEKSKFDLRIEVETILENKPMSEVDFSIKMQKLVAFLYKESTIFFFFLPIFMSSFFYNLAVNGLNSVTSFIGMACVLLYYPFYQLVIKRIIFPNRQKEYDDINKRLEALIEYRDFRLEQQKSQD
jgi:hypothetical protein